MTGQELLELLSKAYRRSHIIGTIENGVIVALDVEGRLFTVVNNKVINRVEPSAIMNRSNKNIYQNPGGDALWPAPEGTCFGYEYNTGKWRVPPSITGAVWEVISKSSNNSVIRAEIDLVNNFQIGLPCEFERHISIDVRKNVLIQRVTEVIRYMGKRAIKNTDFSLAPWSLCQFDASLSGKVIIPVSGKNDIWDLYDSSEKQRTISNGLYEVKIETPKRFQLALGSKIPWIEYVSGNEFRIKRYANNPPKGQHHIDISDSSPYQIPMEKGVKLSVYCDPSGFLEMEACGGCPTNLEPGAELTVDIITEYIICK